MKSNTFSRVLLVMAVVGILNTGASSCKHGVKMDPSAYAVDAGDFTAPILGCGNQLNAGFIVCRRTEGSNAGDSLTFTGPASECLNKESCVSFEVFPQDGSEPYGGVIPKGQTSVQVAWKDLLKTDSFEKFHRGFWGYVYRIKYLDAEGQERETRVQGEIYLRVLSRGYTSLNDTAKNEFFVWNWILNGQQVSMTTAGRVYVGPKQAKSFGGE